MFGWELPPYNSGGLGTACLGLTKELAALGVTIDFIIPKAHGPFPFSHMRIHSAADYASVEEIERVLKLSQEQQALISEAIAYGNQAVIDSQTRRVNILKGAGSLSVSPHAQASWYAYQAAAISRQRSFDVIHCHDWFTYHCGIVAKQVAAARGESVPFIAHIHATEVDRAGGQPGHPGIMAIEKMGLEAADQVVAVSHYTKQMVHKHYGIPLSKISVVHNGIPQNRQIQAFDFHKLKEKYKIVLFMGRLTLMKGPDYFIQLAKKVTAQDPNTLFVMIGSGDQERKCIEQAAAAGLTGRILFSSFLRGSDVDRAYQLADIFVMPSVSEPFGLVALEAMENGTPVIASKQSGVIEVTNNLIPVDFWDVDAMSQAVHRVLNDPHFAHSLREGGKQDLPKLTWANSAATMQQVYDHVLSSLLPANLSLAPVTVNA